MYTLEDTTGYELALHVDNNVTEKVYGSTDPVTSINSNDMRILKDKSSGIFVTDGITYKYVSGELLSIAWVHRGICFKLCGSSMFSNYPITESTFAGKMLNVK